MSERAAEMSGVAIVTGGAAGIGWAIAQRLVSDGRRVIAVDLVPGMTDSSAVGFRRLDVTDEDAVRTVFDELVDEFGSIDVLVNNAGVQLHRPLEALTSAEWRFVVDVNLHGAFHCLQAAGRHMLAAGRGSIVNIASVAARGSAGRAPYATTKGALVALTATAGAEWAARGVRVNGVAPGYVNTGVLQHGVAAGTLRLDRVLNRIPAGRLAEPEEIAAAVSFLASPSASYFAGQTLAIDGGFLVDYGVPLSPVPVSDA